MITTQTLFSHILHSLVTQAVLGGLFGVSVIINIILLIAVVVFLTRTKDTSSQPPPSSRRSKEEDIKMKSNSYHCDDILTKPNEVYGVTTTTEPHHPETYEYVN